MSDVTQLVLTSIRFGARSINFYTFERADGGVLAEAEPGAHITLRLPGGMERQYSLLQAESSPTAYHIAVKREVDGRGGSAWIHDELRVGMSLPVIAPNNHFPLIEGASSTVLIAGGIGITPIYAMAQRLRQRERPFELHYTVRSRAEAILLRELAGQPNVHVRIGEERAGAPFPLAGIVASAPADAHLYCCGPKSILTAFEEAVAATGRPAEQMHVEYFEPKFAAATGKTISVELARSGRKFTVPEGNTILDVLLAAGIYAPHSCSEGVCGACETTVLSGIPDHRDSILSDEERAANATMMICCSGAISDKLVLDL